LAYVPTDFRKTVVFLGQDGIGAPSVCGSAFWIINVQSSEELLPIEETTEILKKYGAIKWRKAT